MDTEIENEPILWDERSFSARTSTTVTAVVGAKAKAIVKLLDLDSWSWDERDPSATGYRGVLHVIGNGPNLDNFLQQADDADPLPDGEQ